MATAMDEFKIPKLGAENYHAWSIRARAALVQKGCWAAIDPGFGETMNNEERNSNDKALTLLFLIVEDTYLDDIGECNRAEEAWRVLNELHTRYGLLHLLQLMKDFFNIQMKNGESIKSYLGRLMEVHRKLSSGGHAFTDREVALVMLIGLPKVYEPLILNLEKDEETISTKIVKARLIVEEKRLSRIDEREKVDDNNERALTTTHARSYSQQTNRWNADMRENKESISGRRNIRCFCCGNWGHIARNCTETHKSNENVAKKAIGEGTHYALCAADNQGGNLNVWYLDSGATEHMTSQKNVFSHFKPSSLKVEIANSEKIEVTGVGDITLTPNDECGNGPITLKDVLYVPNLGGNLLSVGRIEQMGFTVTFNRGRAVISEDKQNGKEILVAHRSGRLYLIAEKPNHQIGLISKHKNEEMWHRRLGHLHLNAVRKIAGKDPKSVKSNWKESGNEETCTVCILGKMKKRPFPADQTERASRPLEIIHSDVVGPIQPTSKGGSKYLVTFIDDYSRYTVVKPMKSKDQVLEKFDEYRRSTETKHNKKIKILRSDNGGEYRNHAFDEYLQKHGILHQLTVPGTPQQNGVAERANQTLFGMTRCMLLESATPNSLWADAVTTACYLRNKCPSKAINDATPESLWTGKHTNIEHLRVFGCRVWSRVDEHTNKGKLGARAQECILIGYPEGVKGYRLWNFKENKFIVSRNVQFQEDVFPLKETLHTQINNTDENELIFKTGNETMTGLTEKTDEILCPKSDININTTEMNKSVNVPKNENGDSTDNTRGEQSLRRTERIRKPIQHYGDPLLYLANGERKNDETSSKITEDNHEPTTVDEAMTSSDAIKWKAAMKEEFEKKVGEERAKRLAERREKRREERRETWIREWEEEEQRKQEEERQRLVEQKRKEEEENLAKLEKVEAKKRARMKEIEEREAREREAEKKAAQASANKVREEDNWRKKNTESTERDSKDSNKEDKGGSVPPSEKSSWRDREEARKEDLTDQNVVMIEQMIGVLDLVEEDMTDQNGAEGLMTTEVERGGPKRQTAGELRTYFGKRSS